MDTASNISQLSSFHNDNVCIKSERDYASDQDTENLEMGYIEITPLQCPVIKTENIDSECYITDDAYPQLPTIKYEDNTTSIKYEDDKTSVKSEGKSAIKPEYNQVSLNSSPGQDTVTYTEAEAHLRGVGGNSDLQTDGLLASQTRTESGRSGLRNNNDDNHLCVDGARCTSHSLPIPHCETASESAADMECWWPSHMSPQSIRKAVKNRMSPDPETWSRRKGRLLHTFATYEEAMEKVKELKSYRDLQTEEVSANFEPAPISNPMAVASVCPISSVSNLPGATSFNEASQASSPVSFTCDETNEKRRETERDLDVQTDLVSSSRKQKKGKSSRWKNNKDNHHCEDAASFESLSLPNPICETASEPGTNVECWWPSHMSPRSIRKAAKNGMDPDPETWTRRKGRVLHTFATYEEAMEKVKELKRHRDLQTDYESASCKPAPVSEPMDDDSVCLSSSVPNVPSTNSFNEPFQVSSPVSVTCDEANHVRPGAAGHLDLQIDESSSRNEKKRKSSLGKNKKDHHNNENNTGCESGTAHRERNIAKKTLPAQSKPLSPRPIINCDTSSETGAHIECWFPPHASPRDIEKAVLDGMKPDPETWARRKGIVHESFATYEEAMEKVRELKEAKGHKDRKGKKRKSSNRKNNKDCNDRENDAGRETGTLHRERNIARKTVPSSVQSKPLSTLPISNCETTSEPGGDIVKVWYPSHLSPRSIRKAIKNGIKPDPKTWTLREARIVQTFDTYEEAMACERELEEASGQTESISRKRDQRNSNSENNDDNQCESSLPERMDESFQASSSVSTAELHIIQSMDNLLKEMKDQVQVLDGILLISKNGSLPSKYTDLPIDIELPLKSVEDVNQLELKLVEEPTVNALVNHLAVIGGSSLKDTVNRTMSRLLDHHVALKYNWTGKRRRNESSKPFGKLQLASVVTKAVMKNPEVSKSTLTDVQNEIMIWLRQSKEQLGGREQNY